MPYAVNWRELAVAELPVVRPAAAGIFAGQEPAVAAGDGWVVELLLRRPFEDFGHALRIVVD